MTRLRAGLALGLLLVTIVGCDGRDPGQQIEFKVPVLVREVEMGTVEDRVVATGTLRAKEAVTLRTETGGVLGIARAEGSDRRLAEGDRVEAEQTIAEITGEEVRLAAGTEATHQRYQVALQDYESKKRLIESGLMSELEFRQVETTLAEAKAEWERSRLTERRSRLVTPIAGVILRLSRDENGQPLADGQLVAAGFEVAQIAPTRTLIGDVDLIGADLKRARTGLQARIRHHAWDDHVFPGRVVRLAPAIDPLTRTLRAEVEVDNREGLLRPGMFIEVTMIADRREHVPVVPRDAVTERGGQKVVFVLVGQRVERREVVLGLGDDEIVEIRSGVEAGERIVVRGLETLSDGTRVRVSGS